MEKELSKRQVYLRTDETWAKYVEHRKTSHPCFFCTKEPIITKGLWRIKKNDFPYDAVSEVHDLLYPTRHIGRKEDLTEEEKMDFEILKNDFNTSYEYESLIENFVIAQSHPSHLHYHLIKWKRKA